MFAVLTVLAVACCIWVVSAAVSGRVPAGTGWTLAAATAATTVIALIAGSVPSRFAASVLAAGCMAESVWVILASSRARRRTARVTAQ